MDTKMNSSSDHSSSHEAHVVPVKTLLAVFVALMALTGLTVGTHYIDLGPANIWLALLIAVAKAALVALFFMHLWWDSKFNGFILIVALLFVALFIGIATLDTAQYQPDFQPPANAAQQ
jgi:cytochrome c oxidase subunit IV